MENKQKKPPTRFVMIPVHEKTKELLFQWKQMAQSWDDLINKMYRIAVQKERRDE